MLRKVMGFMKQLFWSAALGTALYGFGMTLNAGEIIHSWCYGRVKTSLACTSVEV